MRTLTGIALLLAAATLSAQTPAAATPPPPAPLAVHRTTAPITVDGDLSDAGWQGAAVIDRFYETSPGDNTPPKANTTAWVTYDERYFYIGVRCDDPHPEKIRAPYVDRDAVIGTDDNIAVFLDTRNDKRSAIELRVNPRGIQGDAIYNDANGNEDFSPDFYYDTAAKIDDKGWSAEFRIPFSSLRYPRTDPQTWNILVWRNYPREFRYAFQSAPIPRSGNCYICFTHPITGLTGLPEAGHLVAAPYVTAQRVDRPEGDLGSKLGDGSNDFDTGIDIKWNPSATQALDLTINPDFSQIEADVAQITVNQRFAVLYPEKRPFFLEGFDLFDTPLQVAYTRTITSPRFGVRSTGKFGGTAYTVLVSEDRGGGLTILPGPQGSDFALQDSKSIATIGRLRHDIGASFVGAVVTDREVRGGGHNRIIGPDFQWRPGESDTLTGQLLLSDTEDAHTSGRETSHALILSYNHLKRTYDWFADVRHLGNAFRADLGFVPQAGYREVDGGFGLRYFPEHSRFFRFVRPSIFVDHQDDLDGNTIFQQVSVAVNTQGIKNMGLGVAVRPKEQIRVGDQILEQTYAQWGFQIDPSRRFTRISFSGRAGQSIDFANQRVGNGASLSVGTTIRPMDKLTLEGTVNREWLNAQGGRVYTANVDRLKTIYSFSAKSLLRVIGQYVETERDPERYRFPVPRHDGSFLGSILYSYKLNWQTVLFVGYGDDRVLTENADLLRADRSLFFKVSYAWQK